MTGVNLFTGSDGKRLAEGLAWLRKPSSWGFGPAGLEIVPDGQTDFFRPAVGSPKDNACLLYTRVTGDFTAVAEASAVLVGFGDAAALTVRSDESHWAKICIERSPRGEVSIVSVVTSGTSDDSNNELLPSPAASLRLTRHGRVFGMQYRAASAPGAGAGAGPDPWRFVRTFGLEMPDAVMVGVHAQAPFVAGCRATFTTFELSPVPVKDLRSGE
jgi:regulation of enolase protein 1 (concanavalin A-like superfamily)